MVLFRKFQEKPLKTPKVLAVWGVLLNCFLEVKCEVTALKVPKEAIVIGPWFPGVLSAWDTFEVVSWTPVHLSHMYSCSSSFFLLTVALSLLFLEDRPPGPKWSLWPLQPGSVLNSRPGICFLYRKKTGSPTSEKKSL